MGRNAVMEGVAAQLEDPEAEVEVEWLELVEAVVEQIQEQGWLK